MTIYRVARVISPFELDIPSSIRFGCVHEDVVWGCSHVLLNFSNLGEKRLQRYLQHGFAPLIISVIDPKDRNNLLLAQSQLPIVAEYVDRHGTKESINKNGGITVGIMHDSVMNDQRHADVSRFVTRFIESCNDHPDSIKVRRRIRKIRG